MTLLRLKEIFKSIKCNEKIGLAPYSKLELYCFNCKKLIHKFTKIILVNIEQKPSVKPFCSIECKDKYCRL